MEKEIAKAAKLHVKGETGELRKGFPFFNGKYKRVASSNGMHAQECIQAQNYCSERLEAYTKVQNRIHVTDAEHKKRQQIISKKTRPAKEEACPKANAVKTDYA